MVVIMVIPREKGETMKALLLGAISLKLSQSVVLLLFRDSHGNIQSVCYSIDAILQLRVLTIKFCFKQWLATTGLY